MPEQARKKPLDETKMPDTPDAAPDPANGGTPAEQPVHIHALRRRERRRAGAAQDPAAAPEEAQASSARWSLSNISWQRLAIALLVLAAGAVASVLGARAVARSNADSARTAFQHASTGTAGAVKLALAHQDGVLTASGTYLSKNPAGQRRRIQELVRLGAPAAQPPRARSAQPDRARAGARTRRLQRARRGRPLQAAGCHHHRLRHRREDDDRAGAPEGDTERPRL